MSKKKSSVSSKKSTRGQHSKKTEELIAKGRKYFTQNYRQREMIVDRAQGTRIYDVEGHDYVDFGAGIAVCALGYGDTKMMKALDKQAHKIWHTSNIFFTEPPILLAEELLKSSKFAKRVFFCNSGGEANEAAIKLARKYAANKGKPPSKRKIITFTGSFHGRTLATVTATAQPKYQEGFEPLPGGFEYCAFNNFKAIRDMMSDDVCAILVETVQGEGGVVPSAPGYLAHLRKLCDKHDALLMFDQVQCGMGRTGKLFSHWHEPGVKPDVVTLAKGLGGGIPIGAMLAGPKVSEVFQFGHHGTTFGGNPLVCAVSLEVLKRLKTPELMRNVNKRGQQLVDGLAEISDEFGLFKEIRGRGLMIGAELNKKWHGQAGAIGERCRADGVLILAAGPNVLRFLPPLVITEKEIKIGLERLRKGLVGYLEENG